MLGHLTPFTFLTTPLTYPVSPYPIPHSSFSTSVPFGFFAPSLHSRTERGRNGNVER